ncbi:MAG TPA: sigma-70 family RNA polymerase sigma factor [Chitinophaga sp.]|uniref:RNA polymerase sigma factor n=1 Tax=Chitinophaga sp. TaxID=1869181 RepID=UPI002BF80311|nr:sigma-70 family RNA polymerase sigma factor [Chitinophaga sp.]HVI44029.1 sigma-70 family RNA polymerase sigma factor [Chitinophaga sp.]
MSNKEKYTIAEVYELYWKELYIAAYRRLQSPADVEDVLHDLFLALLRTPEVMERDGSIRAYLHQSLKHRIIDNYRKARVRPRPEDDTAMQEEVSPMSSDASLITRDMEKRVMEEVNRMPEKMKEIYLLSRRDHLPNNQIAHHLNISLQTVKNQISSALKRVKTVLSNNG